MQDHGILEGPVSSTYGAPLSGTLVSVASITVDTAGTVRKRASRRNTLHTLRNKFTKRRVLPCRGKEQESYK